MDTKSQLHDAAIKVASVIRSGSVHLQLPVLVYNLSTGLYVYNIYFVIQSMPRYSFHIDKTKLDGRILDKIDIIAYNKGISYSCTQNTLKVTTTMSKIMTDFLYELSKQLE